MGFLISDATMRSFIMAAVVLGILGKEAIAWGGLFNRFSPELLANMGYGGHGGFIQVTIHLMYTVISQINCTEGS